MDSELLGGDAFVDGIQRATTAQIVSDKLVFMIASGLLDVGDALPSERDLARTLGISRTTARRAIQLMAERGLIEIAQGARTRVVRVPSDSDSAEMPLVLNLAAHDLRSVYAARRTIEREILQDVARTISTKTIARLNDLVEAQADMLADRAAFQISDREFHETIYRAGSNPVLSELALGLYAYGLGYRRKVLSLPGAIARSHADHRRIIEALMAHDPQNAALRADEHLVNIYDTTSDAMRNPSPPDMAR